MHRSFSSRRYFISTLIAAGAAATVPACGNPELPPGLSDEVVVAQKAPPPISGGTLLVTSKGVAVAADPDRDVLWVVDLNKPSPKRITLNADDEPGRVVEDGAGRVHVALRRSGDVVTIDPAAASVLDRSPACPAPRGMAYNAKDDTIHVACAGGELVTMPAAGGAAVKSVQVTDSSGREVKDLRDIVVSGDKLLISRFRQAEVLVLNSDGTLINRDQPPSFNDNGNPEGVGFAGGSFSPTGAWRMVPLSGGGVVVSHQRSLTTPVIISQPDGYGGRDDGTGCSGGIVHPAITAFDANGNVKVPNGSPIIPQATLPVDMAVSSDGDTVAIVAAGSDKVITSSLSNIEAGANNGGGCLSISEPLSVGAPIAAAYWGDTLIVQSREPASITIFGKSGQQKLVFSAPSESVKDTGHYIFHHEASDTSHIACASCHLEGHDDAHTWTFDSIGARRTQTLGGDIFQTAPFHWDGDMLDLGMIMHEVFQNRMGGDGKMAGPRHTTVLQGWMGNIPRLPVSRPNVAQASIDHGAQLFVDAKCATCHSGTMFTNNTNQDVGTGKAFQVPSLLGLSNRAPYLHDGSAATIRDRFPAPGVPSQHGDTTVLKTEQDIDDLVAYLQTL